MSRLRAAADRALRARLGEANAGRALAALAPTLSAAPVTDAPAGPCDLAREHECSLPASVRRASGIYYTPGAVADALLADVPGRADRIIDPSCGGGAFLLGALRARIVDSPNTLFGVDSDPVAVEIARLSVFIESGADPAMIGPIRLNIRCNESLTHDWADEAGSFDAVFGNPPFVDSETMTRESPALRAAVRKRYASARGNWDLSVPFVDLALRLARPGGIVALVVPRQILGSDYAAALQSALLRHEIVAVRDLDGSDLFDGAAAPVALLTVRKRAPARGHHVQFTTLDSSLRATSRTRWPQTALESLPPGHMLAPLSPDAAPLLGRLRTSGCLRGVASVSDGATTAEAYRIRDALKEREVGGPDAVRLVNTGTIDPFVTRWGERPTVYLKRRLVRPVIDREALSRIAPRRLAQADQPKVVVAGLCRRIEAVALPGGWLCAKSAVLVLPRDGVCPLALAAYLNAPSTSALHRALFAGRSLGRGALHIAPRQLEQLPVPDPHCFAPGGALSILGQSRPAPSDDELDCAVAACFNDAAAGTISTP